MFQQKDTHTVAVDEPVEDVLLKIQEGVAVHQRRSDVYEDEASSSLSLWHRPEGSGPTWVLPEVDSASEYAERARTPFLEWLSVGAIRLSRGLVASLAATQINLARMNFDGLGTAGFDARAIIEAVQQDRWVRVTVSPELVKTRAELFASSLFAPSGAELTWLALEEAGEHGEV